MWGLKGSLWRWLDCMCQRVQVGMGVARRCDNWHLNIVFKYPPPLDSHSLVFRFYFLSQRNRQHQQYMCWVEVNRLAALRLKPVLDMEGSTASTAAVVTRLRAAVRLVALWKEAASASQAALAIRLPGKHLAQPDRPVASAAAGASHPSTPPRLPRLLSWEAAALSADSTKDPLEMVIFIHVWFMRVYVSFSSMFTRYL